MSTILILGAGSGIAEAFAFEALKKGHRLVLAGTDLQKTQVLAEDLKIRTDAADITCLEFNCLKTRSHAKFFREVLKACPELDGCLAASGVMYDNDECLANFDLCKKTIDVNFTGLVSILNIIAAHFEKEKKGFISCISSVAGDRGRPGNYIYGAAKGAMSTYLDGLRNRLFKSEVLVQTVKPGPVDTKMTRGLEGMPFLIPPQKAAADILKGIEKKKDIVYTPFVWYVIMTIIKLLPVRIYKRLNF